MSAIFELFRDHTRHAAATALDDDTTRISTSEPSVGGN